MAGEVAAAKQYARLKMAQNRPAKRQRGGSGAKSGTPTDDERKNGFEILDEIAQNPLTASPTRKVFDDAKRKKGLKLGRGKTSVIMREWRENRKRNGPHGPQRTD
jgi:hypothetical protein